MHYECFDMTYHLEKYNGPATRYTCPECRHKRTFTRYIDTDGNHLGDEFGRCDREAKCGYHKRPELSGNSLSGRRTGEIFHVPPKPIAYMPLDIVQATLKHYAQNSFVAYLERFFGYDVAWSLCDKYKLGTTKNGACIFWQIEDDGVRTGKVIKYKPDGHRDKTVPPYFVHKQLNIDATQCLFGLHLADDGKLIALVESEKTAVVMAGKLPGYTWLATGGKSNLSLVDVLKGRKVVCFPDSDAYEHWKERLSPYGFKVSDALQKHLTADEQREGLDLADMIAAEHFVPVVKSADVLIVDPSDTDFAGNRINAKGYPCTWDLNWAA